MATQKFAAAEIKGYSPSMEPTVTDTIFALNGRNYMFDSRGPISMFGNRVLCPYPFMNPEYIQGKRLHFKDGDITLTITVDGIYLWDENQGGWVLLYQTEDTSTGPYRWTVEYLEQYIYLCHPMMGILVYNPSLNVIQPIDQVAIVPPTQPIAIAVNNGRLCVIDPIFFSWSMPSNGLDFTPALGGGGFQQISDRVGGTPIMITSYAGATLTWTTGGVLRSEFTGDAAVFRHRSLSTDVRPANSFCVVGVANDTSIILDERGLYMTQGDIPQQMDTDFNQFLRDYIRNNHMKENNRLRVEWDELQRKFYLSMSLAYASQGFDRCFVMNPDLAKWGEFSEFHYGVLPIHIDSSHREGDYYSYCDSTGRIRCWLPTPTTEQLPSVTSYQNENLYYPVVDKPAMPSIPYTGTILATTIKAYSWDASTLAISYARAGYYDEGTGTSALVSVGGLNSTLNFGLFRPTGPSAFDEASEVLDVMIRSWPSQDPNIDTEDYEWEDGAEDFLSSPNPNVDYGDGPIYSNVNHQVTVHSTFDGVSDCMTVTPVIVQWAQNARYYSCSTVGVWHSIEISALEPGESFHIVGGEITAASAGRIL